MIKKWKKWREHRVLVQAARLLAQEAGIKLMQGEEMTTALSMLVLSLTLAKEGKPTYLMWRQEMADGRYVHESPGYLN